ncbi:MAG: MFS transporter [Ramlibacter sp.]
MISLVNDSASEMMYPLIPLYLSGVLMAGPKALGLIEGLAEAIASLLKLVSGVWADRTGRSKPWIIAGYGVAGLARPLIAFATVWPLLLLLRVLDRIGKPCAPRRVTRCWPPASRPTNAAWPLGCTARWTTPGP